MKSLLKNIVRDKLIGGILGGGIVRFAKFVMHHEYEKTRHAEKEIENAKLEKIIKSISPNLVVLHGFFQGMRYPEVKSVGSSLVPKIIGSYEKELHQVLDMICSNEYSEIVDVGCAEGYYAVGLAIRIPTAKVFAYDINRDAIHLCKQMADINNVAHRFVIGDFCDSETLKSIPYTKKALVVIDCEGYEKQLLTEDVVPFLENHDLLIEIHDFIDIEISSVIRKRFEGTHSIKVVQSIDDIAKVHSYNYPELDEYSLEDRKFLLNEERPHIMEWFYMTPLLRD